LFSRDSLSQKFEDYPMAVSQKQIAQKLGVSIALVSRVLSGKALEIGIAPATIEKVLKTAEELGYVPSAAALSLKGKPTRTIGVTVYDFNDPFFGALIKQIQIQAHEHKYSLVLAGFLNRIPDEQDLQSLHKHAIDGLIVLGSDTHAGWLENFGHLPIARIGHGSPDDPGFKVTIDETDAAEKLARMLHSAGKKEVVFLGGGLPVHRLRREAFCAAAKSFGIKTSFIRSSESETSPFDAALHSVRQLMNSPVLPGALVCATDQIAMGALHALHDAGIAVPAQMAVTISTKVICASRYPRIAAMIPAIMTKYVFLPCNHASILAIIPIIISSFRS